MPPSDSQAFRRKLFLWSGDIPVAGGGVTAAGMSRLPFQDPYLPWWG